jgi:hypothetical protein
MRNLPVALLPSSAGAGVPPVDPSEADLVFEPHAARNDGPRIIAAAAAAPPPMNRRREAI